MRFSEGPTTHCEIHVEATVSRVWELATDIGLPARLSPELLRTEWIGDATAAALGACFEGYNHHPMLGEWRTVSQVVELDAERVFGWVVMDADGRYGEPAQDLSKPLASWRFALEAEAGGTLLRQSVRVGPGNSGLSVTIARMPDKEEMLVSGRLSELRTGIEATLRGIKEYAEGGR